MARWHRAHWHRAHWHRADRLAGKTARHAHRFMHLTARVIHCQLRDGFIGILAKGVVQLMSRQEYVFTSESVSEGHPDKVCDRISDEVVDACLAQSGEARVACETLATTNLVVIAGETRVAPSIDPAGIEDIARRAIRDIGYEQEGFHWKTARIDVRLHGQSCDIARGVDGAPGREEGAGDQGIMFGHACRETPELMPAPILYAHKVLRTLAATRRAGDLPMLGPDAKCQLSVRYRGGVPVHIDTIVLSTQHLDADLDSQQIRQLVEPVVRIALPGEWVDDDTLWHVNPTGKFVIGGPDGDCGLTGRKIIVDTYGGAAPHGGGAFSGKDPTKVDRSAAYAARYLAKNIVAADIAPRCTIQLSYAIGVAHPLSIYLNLPQSAKSAPDKIAHVLPGLMDLSPRGIRTRLGLDRPIYSATAAYGHFGREADNEGRFSWEKLDLVEPLRRALA